MPDTPTITKLTRLVKSYAAFVTAAAALITAFKSYTKPTDTTPARATFETVSTELEKISVSQAKLYEDLAGLQAYVLAHERPGSGASTGTGSGGSSGVGTGVSAGAGAGGSGVGGGVSVSLGGSGVGGGVGFGAGLTGPGAAGGASVGGRHAVLRLSPKPVAWKAPSFDRVLAAYENAATGAAAVAAMQESAPALVQTQVSTPASVADPVPSAPATGASGTPDASTRAPAPVSAPAASTSTPGDATP